MRIRIDFYKHLRKALFNMNAETAHYLTLNTLRYADKFGITRCFSKTIISPQEVMGLHFQNPVGLAAGLDKNGDYIDALATLGFGFLEVGTITPKPQEGNAKPRLFRLVAEEALIN